MSPADKTTFPLGTAASRGLNCCHTCGRLATFKKTHCPRCHTHLHPRIPHSLQRTLALTLAAAVLYIPANTMPIMVVTAFNGTVENTILGGVVTFWEMHAYPVAAIIFIASVVIPILKLISLVWLCVVSRPSRRAENSPAAPHRATRIYRLTELVGRWSMVDVFVVTILVAVVQFGQVMSISPGPAALAFAAVVVLTMLAAHSFDPRLIWDAQKKHQSS